MAEKKFSKNAVDYMKTDPKYPKFRLETDPEIVKNIVQVDSDTVPGAEFYSEAKWIMPPPSALPAARRCAPGDQRCPVGAGRHAILEASQG